MSKPSDSNDGDPVTRSAVFENSTEKSGTGTQKRWGHGVVEIVWNVEAPLRSALIVSVVASKNRSVSGLSVWAHLHVSRVTGLAITTMVGKDAPSDLITDLESFDIFSDGNQGSKDLVAWD